MGVKIYDVSIGCKNYWVSNRSKMGVKKIRCQMGVKIF